MNEVVDIADEEAWQTAAAVAVDEGLPIGISAGAALAAATKLASREDFVGKKIVAILPDSINNYLSNLPEVVQGLI